MFKIVNREWGHSAAGWGTGGSVGLQTVEGPKYVHLGNWRPLIALHCLLLMLVSTPLQNVNRHSGFR